MQILKPLLAGAALLTLSIPALASAQPYDGYRDYGRYDGYHADRGGDFRGDGWRRDAGGYGYEGDYGRHAFRWHRHYHPYHYGWFSRDWR